MPLARIGRFARATVDRPTRTGEPIAPGRRFIVRFEDRAHIHRLHPSRLLRIIVGVGLFAFGMANIFIPGPGGSVFILGSALVLAGESRTFARVLDAGELRFQRPIQWVLRHPFVAVATISALVFAGITAIGIALAR